MSAKRRCGNCKEFFPKDEMIETTVQAFCSIDCLNEKRYSPKKRAKKGSIPSGVRAQVLERDKNICRLCKTKDNLHLHHIIYRSQGGKHIESNLVTLCMWCHDTVHSNKNEWQPKLLEMITYA